MAARFYSQMLYQLSYSRLADGRHHLRLPQGEYHNNNNNNNNNNNKQLTTNN